MLKTNPEKKQPEGQKNNSRLILWLLILSLAGFSVPLLLVGTTLQEDLVTMNSDVAVQQTTLEASLPENPERQQLLTQLNQVKTDTNVLDSLYTSLVEGSINWSEILSGLGVYEAGQLIITGIEQDNTHLIVTGQALEETAIMNYAIKLRENPIFNAVTVQTITRDELESSEIISEFGIFIEISMELEASD